jgi:hypothetical protein
MAHWSEGHPVGATMRKTQCVAMSSRIRARTDRRAPGWSQRSAARCRPPDARPGVAAEPPRWRRRWGQDREAIGLGCRAHQVQRRIMPLPGAATPIAEEGLEREAQRRGESDPASGGLLQRGHIAGIGDDRRLGRPRASRASQTAGSEGVIGNLLAIKATRNSRGLPRPRLGRPPTGRSPRRGGVEDSDQTLPEPTAWSRARKVQSRTG